MDEEVDDINIEENEDLDIPTKKNVFVLVLLSIITLGIYPTIWYIKRQNELNNLNTSVTTKKFFTAIPLLMIIITIFLILIGFLAGSTTWRNNSVKNLPLSYVVWFFLVIALMFIYILFYFILVPFKFRRILNKALYNKQVDYRLSGFFTFIFNVFYLQYEINRIIDDREEEPRTAPWVVLILLSMLFVFLIGIFIIFNILIKK